MQRTQIIGLLLGLAPVLSGVRAAGAPMRPVEQQVAADPTATVEISNVAGDVTVTGADQPTVSVHGQIGARVERVEVTGGGQHVAVRVILPREQAQGSDGAAHLTIQVPREARLEISTVSADIGVSGVRGSQRLTSASGDVRSDGGGDAHIESVSGDIRLNVAGGAAAEVRAVSGNLTIGGAGGTVAAQTVSGAAHLQLTAVQHLHLQTVSGDIEASGQLAPGAQVDGQTISGTLSLSLHNTPGTEFELHSVSGSISSCTAPSPTHPDYGPGSSLQFRTGDGRAHVALETQSGDLKLCAR